MECEPNKTIKKQCMEYVCHESGKFASCVASKCGEGETSDKIFLLTCL